MARWAATQPDTMEACGNVASQAEVRPRGSEPAAEAQGAAHATVAGALALTVEVAHVDAAGAPLPEGSQAAAETEGGDGARRRGWSSGPRGRGGAL
jgi:hypothetical protein